MWEALQQHGPTVVLAGGIAALIAIGRQRVEASSLGDRYGCLLLALSYGRAVLLGYGGGSLSAAALVEHLPKYPWLVVSLGALCGLSIDLATAAGPGRLLRLLLRIGSRTMRALADEDSRKQP